MTASTGSSTVSSITCDTNLTPARCASTALPANTPAILRSRVKGHVDHEIVPRHAGDFEQLPMQRIVLDGAFDGPGVAHELRAVQDLDRFLGGEAGRDQLSASGKAQHQVRLDESQRDVQIGGNKALIDVDRRAGGGRAERLVLGHLARVVVDDPVGGRDRFPDDFADLGVGGRAVQTGGDQDGNRVPPDSRLLEPREDGRQHLAVRRRTGDVADGDGGARFPASQIEQRKRGDRAIESGFNRPGGIGQRLGRAGFEHPVVESVRERRRESRLTERQIHPHTRQRSTVARDEMIRRPNCNIRGKGRASCHGDR